MTVIVFIAVFVVGVVLGVFAVLVAGIRREDRRVKDHHAAVMDLTRTELAARRVLSREPVEVADRDEKDGG